MGDVTRASKSCAVQISYENAFVHLKCTLFKVHHFQLLAAQFSDLIQIENIKIVWVSVSGHLSKIWRDFKCDDVVKTLKHTINLGSFVYKRNTASSGVTIKNVSLIGFKRNVAQRCQCEIFKVVILKLVCSSNYTRFSWCHKDFSNTHKKLIARSFIKTDETILLCRLSIRCFSNS